MPDVGRLIGLQVLIVDDNETNCRILVEMCRNWSMCPTAVCGADEALDQLRQRAKSGPAFDLVLTDAAMPGTDGFTLSERIRDDDSLGSTLIMMLTSLDGMEDIRRCEQMGIRSYRHQADQTVRTVRRDRRRAGDRANRRRTAQSVAEPSMIRALRILLAEDSIANQKLACGLLGRWNHQVIVANNGREAVAAARGGQFDVILMDVQMPELDGLEATAEIRRWESERSAPRTPIIAMTAHAMKGDRERCLDGGMDDYVSKPVRPNLLLEALVRHCGDSDSAGIDSLVAQDATGTVGSEDAASIAIADSHPTVWAAAAGANGVDDDASTGPIESSAELTDAVVGTGVGNGCIDWKAARKNAYDDDELLREVIEAYLEEMPSLLGQIDAAIASGNCKDAQRLLHTIKGSLRTFGATAVALAQHLEESAERENLGDVQEHLPQLLANLTDVERELRGFSLA
ncbi:MAG: response regulator [Planctomycetaceae bacterium]